MGYLGAADAVPGSKGIGLQDLLVIAGVSLVIMAHPPLRCELAGILEVLAVVERGVHGHTNHEPARHKLSVYRGARGGSTTRVWLEVEGG